MISVTRGFAHSARARRVTLPRRWSIHGSVSAVALAIASAADAQCTPDPVAPPVETLCTGNDPDGLVIDSQNGTVRVAVGAVVNGIQAAGSANLDAATFNRLDVQGTVTGGVQILAPIFPAPPGFGPSNTLAIIVGATGVIEGPTAILLNSAIPPGGLPIEIRASIANSGRIVSTNGGPAIVGATPLQENISTIENRIGGEIGGIDASVDAVSNSGLIDGGAVSALNVRFPPSLLNQIGGFRFLINGETGTLRSASAAGTVRLNGLITPASITNEGLITNSVGSAIVVTASSPSFGVLNNGGTISAPLGVAIDSGSASTSITNRGTLSGGTAAIVAAGALRLLNEGGTIEGDIVAAAAPPANVSLDSEINLVGGTVAGDIRLGAGNDLVIAMLDPLTGGLGGLTGTIDAGGGDNALRGILARGTDLVLSAPPAVPGGFQSVALGLSDETKLTLAPSFAPAGPFRIVSGLSGASGSLAGTLINQAAFSVSGPFLAAGTGRFLFENSGSITVDLAAPAPGDELVFAFESGGRLVNTGLLTVTGGNAVSFAAIENSGTIVASGVAANQFIGTGFVNSGTIRSTGGLAVRLFDSATRVNTGTIEGATAGVELRTTLRNSGTIAGLNGPAVLLPGEAAIINLAGGVLRGGNGVAIASGFANPFSNARIVNAGLIEGSIGTAPGAVGATNNRVILLAGGEVRGDILLGGGGDELVIPFASLTPTGIAGVTGSIGGNGRQTLRLLVDGDTSTTIPSLGPFQTYVYQLSDDTALSLGGSASGTSLGFAGGGAIDLRVDLSGDTATGLGSTLVDLSVPRVSLATGGLESDSGPSMPEAISRGTLSLVLSASSGARPSVVAASGAFENAGTILFEDRRGTISTDTVAAIELAGNLVNSGTIRIGGGGAVGISHGPNDVPDGGRVTNSGQILGVNGLAGGIGIRGARLVRNTGTIRTDGIAIVAGRPAPGQTLDVVVNSGTIESLGATAILGPDFAQNGTRVLNEASGIIRAVGRDAIVFNQGGTVDNAGSIVGDVTFGLGGSFPSGTGTYIARGGTLDGDLTFGATGRVIVFGDGPVATGMVEARGDADLFARALRASGTVNLSTALPAGFELPGAGAIGADTSVTVTASADLATPLQLFGDGRIVNRANVSGPGFGAAIVLGELDALAGSAAGLDFANEAVVRSVAGRARGFSNSGTIGAADLDADAAVGITAAGASFSFANSGRIEMDTGIRAADPRTVRIDDAGMVALETLAFANSGEILGGTRIDSTGRAITVSNSGTLTGRDVDFGFDANGLELVQREPVPPALAAPGSVTIQNSGRIEGLVQSSTAASIEITNSGAIERTRAPRRPTQQSALIVRNFASGDSSATLANTGGILSTQIGTGAIDGHFGNRNGADENGVVAPVAAAVTIDNGGTIKALGGALVAPGLFSPVTDVTLNAGIALTTGPNVESTVSILNRGGRIEATGVVSAAAEAGLPQDFGNVAILVQAERFALDNAAAIVGGAGTDLSVLPADRPARLSNDAVQGAAFIAGAIHTVGSVDTIVNRASGTIIGSIDLGDLDDSFENFGAITGTVLLRDGDDRFTIGALSRLTGIVDGGSGLNTLVIDTTGGTGGALALDPYRNFGAITFTGTGNVGIAGDIPLPAIALAGGSLTIAAGDTLATTGTTTIVGSDAAETVVNNGTIAGAVALGGGDDRFTNAGTLGGSLALGAGADRLVNAAGATIGQADLGAGDNRVENAGRIDMLGFQAGNDTLVNSGIVARLTLGGGNDSVENAGTIGGTLTFADGNDTLVNSATLQDIVFGGGTNRLTNSGGAGVVSFGGGDDLVVNGGTIARLVLGDGDDSVVNSGDLSGAPVDLGAGDDSFRFAPGGRAGPVEGGAGFDTLALDLGGTEAAPADLPGGATGFESLRTESGVVALGRAVAFDSVIVAGGRLIGGPSLTAPTVRVLEGATFGSAGTVTGNVQVLGTLAPGASPGTMTVNGNVTLAGGSTTAFELSPAGNDLLLISGTLDIAAGARLTITQAGAPRPGEARDLIIADGGITGAFTSISTQGVLGFVRQTRNRIELLGQFLRDGFAPQVGNTIDYVNAVLVGGGAPAGLIEALPVLLTPQGGTDGGAFARLNAEAYASAGQIGTEHGLAIATATRATPLVAADKPGLFGFGNFVANRRDLDGDRGFGVGSADIRTTGLFGGLGFGSAEAAVGVFVGGIDSSQRVGGIGASNDADGLVAGVIGHYAAGPLTVRATIAYDGSAATTVRTLPTGESVRGAYDLDSWIGDAALSYAIPAAPDWSIVPELGFTWVQTRRGGAVEASATPFALAVRGDRRDASFVDGAVTLRSAPEGEMIQSWVKAGVRQQLTGAGSFALAGFRGAGAGLLGTGAERSETTALVGAGLAADLGGGIRLFGNYQAEFGGSGNGHNATIGFRLGF